MTRTMKHIITAITFNGIMYLLPLFGQPELMLSAKILVLFAAATILFLTQPPLSLKEAREKKSSDRNSVYFIMVAAMFSQIVSVVDWAYPGVAGNIQNGVTTVLGAILIGGGIWFRIWAIRTLGRFFTSTVQIQANHQVITSGPYSIVRHPSYLGAYAAVVGSALFLGSVAGLIVSAVLMILAYHMRIAFEESAMELSLGEPYREYRKTTYRLIPCVW